MMYGFGDTETPLQETTDLVEDMTIDYLTDFVRASFLFPQQIRLLSAMHGF